MPRASLELLHQLADHTYMLFGDAKAVVGELVKQLQASSGH